MICPKCKTENKENAKFCLSCGTNLQEVNQEKKVEKQSEKVPKKEDKPKKDYSKPIKPIDSKINKNKFKKILFYKEEKNAFVLSKTKVISLIILVIFFIIGLYVSFTNPTITGPSVAKVIASFVVGLTAAVPAYIIGILIRKFA